MKNFKWISGLVLMAGSVLFFPTETFASEIKIKKIKSGSGKIDSAWTRHMEGRLYVSGRVIRQQPISQSIGAHVDATLVGKEGKIVARNSHRLTSASRRHTGVSNHSNYVVTFSSADVAKAHAIHLYFHNASPGGCEREATRES